MANINHNRKNTGSETTILNPQGNSSPNSVKLRTLNVDASYCQLSSSLSYKDRPKNFKIIHQNIHIHLFTFRRSIQDYKIHGDMEIVTFELVQY